MQETTQNKLARPAKDKETIHDVSLGRALYLVQCPCHHGYVEVPLEGFARCRSCRRRHSRKTALQGRPIRPVTLSPCEFENLPSDA